METQLPEVSYRPTVPALLRRAVDEYGDNDFVVLPDERISFRQAECRSSVVARSLLAAGAGKGSRVGILLPTGIDWVVTWLATARIGGISLLLPATVRPPELRRAMAIGDVAMLFAPSRLFGKDYETFLEEAIPSLKRTGTGPIYDLEVPYLRTIWVVGGSDRPWTTDVSSDDGTLTEVQLAAVEAEVSPADPLLVIYTSGSSADPKAIVHTHGAAIRKIQPQLRMSLPGSFSGRTFCAMPFFWVGGPQNLLGALHSGATIVTQARFEATEALELLEREQCTSIVGWANILQRLQAEPTYSSRKLALVSTPTVAVSSRGHPRNLGMTETFGPHANPEWFDYKVIDPRSGRQLADGEEGEFCVRGFGLMSALYAKEKEEIFDADAWYHTGDRGYIEEGTIWFTGRYSEMIKSGGANVSPLEVERVLAAQSDVAMAFVLGVPDGEKSEAVAAVIVLQGEARLDTEDLRHRINKELSAYKVPTRWLILEANDVPFLASGKPDKRALRDRF